MVRCSSAGFAERHIPALLSVASPINPAAEDRRGRRRRRRRARVCGLRGRLYEPRRRRPGRHAGGHGGPGAPAGRRRGRRTVGERGRGRRGSAVRRAATITVVVVVVHLVRRISAGRRRRAAAQDGARLGHRRSGRLLRNAAASAGRRAATGDQVPVGAGGVQRRDGRSARPDLLPSASRRLLTPTASSVHLAAGRSSSSEPRAGHGSSRAQSRAKERDRIQTQWCSDAV